MKKLTPKSEKNMSKSEKNMSKNVKIVFKIVIFDPLLLSTPYLHFGPTQSI